MAQMNPTICPSNPPGETRVYQALRNLPGTDSWRVFHSLNIADHTAQERGETDFVIVIPGRGVICLEVKSHTRVSRDADGRWRLGKETGKQPFEQAANNSRSIRTFLQKKEALPWATPVVEAVWFTHCPVRENTGKNIEWHEETLLDSTDFDDRLKSRLLKIVDQAKERLAKRFTTYRQPCQLSGQRVNQLCQSLRPKFDVSLCLTQAGKEERLTLLDEQYAALDTMQDNRAVVFTGPAGTGKTVLAAEKVARESAAGNRSLLLCYNKALAENLKSKVPAAENVTIDTFHTLLMQIADVTLPAGATNRFWQDELPEKALAAISSGRYEPAECLVIDEAQDLVHSNYLVVLDALVKGGLAQGKVMFFGDFEHQSIYSHSEGYTLESLQQDIPGIAIHRLAQNYRNLPRVGQVFESLCTKDQVYTRYRRNDDGQSPIVYTYSTSQQHLDSLREALKILQDEGFSRDQIVVLSPRTASKAMRLPPTQRGSKAVVHHSSIHKYKGLEAPAIIITDVDDSVVHNFTQVLGVGVTRALERLVLIAEHDTHQRLLPQIRPRTVGAGIRQSTA